MRVEIAYKFIFGFIITIGAVVGVEYGVSLLDLPQWSKGIVPTLVAIAVGLILGYGYAGLLSKNVSAILSATERMAEGDLKNPIEMVKRPVTDEFDDLAYAINRLHDSLESIVGRIVTAANELAVSTETFSASTQEMRVSGEQISSSMEEVARGVGHQKESVADVATLIHEQTLRLESIARSCEEVALAAREARRKSESGSANARRTFEDLQDAVSHLEETARVFVAFSDRIQQIHRFAEIITNISRQTNLLALNAAIEATKAGPEGKGFAVVADEIRRLADNSERSADQIATMLNQLSEENRRVRGMVEASVNRVIDSRGRLATAGSVLDEITGLVEQNAERMARIPSLVDNQVKTNRDVERLVNRIGEVAESNAAAAFEVTATVQHQTSAMHEIASGAMRISNVAEGLHHQVVRFKIRQKGLEG